MKLSTTSAAAILACLATSLASPTVVKVAGAELTPRHVATINNAIASLNEYTVKRDLTVSAEELAKRDYPIVTQVLTAINSTGLAPGIIQYFIDDPQLSQIATNVIVDAVKSGLVDLPTLLKALNDSGLAVQVIKDLISDCQFYAEIYKLVLQQIGNLGELISSILKGLNPFNKREMEEYEQLMAMSKRSYETHEQFAKRASSAAPAPTSGFNEQEILTNLMDSLKKSGLASQVVKQLVTDDKFYTWGASLIENLFKSNAITIPQLIDALAQSGLIPSLIKNFLNLGTFKTVIVNALAAATGNCKGNTLTTVKPSTTIPISSSTLPPATTNPSGTPTSICKKRKRRSY
ncbi:uncharacterized protein CANTADRAFT_27411 [Suhomyces tanzawaensis NRRL Y-17324]|uniref:Opaque-phase-specific protein OP4 n=1 Tax=Suhomyces tanzawaensis NRRL Y-17324 TaxID=984487 RepID=A0A1E4SBY2_9ASCO|nr:uncharacterized protein CANTADRAFT_27411 [Suhomyces tanzawaensis NRRL Y-17324]ODV76988.1 hypothetical protein CANTADRAFT_27411 [Suhomyces tanzawaensis NRRL Y-17324]